MRLLMPVVSFACLLLTPIQSLSRKRGEENAEIDHRAKPTPPANSSIYVNSILPGETKMETKFSIAVEPTINPSQGPYYPGNTHATNKNTNPPKPQDAEAQTSIQSSLSDFDKLSMSVDHSLEMVKNPLNERQGYFPSILTPSNYVHLKSPNDVGLSIPPRSSDKTDVSSFYKTQRKPLVETAYYPAPGPGSHKTRLYSYQPNVENYKSYVYPTSSGSKYVKSSFSPTSPTEVSGFESGPSEFEGGVSGYGTASSFRENLKPLKPPKEKLKTVAVRYKEITPDEEESLLNFADFTEDSKEAAGSSSSENKYQLDENEEPNEEEIEVEPEREVIGDEEEEDEEAIQDYPPKIKHTKTVFRRPVIKEIIKVPVQKDQIKQYNVKRPQSYVENTVRHHEVSIKNTYPASGPSIIKTSAIPELSEEIKPLRGPLLRAPSSGSPTSARVAPIILYHPIKPLTMRPMAFGKPEKAITIYIKNRNQPIILGPQKMGAFDHIHRHRHRHLPMCAPCMTPPRKARHMSHHHMRHHHPHHHHHRHRPHGMHTHHHHHHRHRPPHKVLRAHALMMHKSYKTKHKADAIGCIPAPKGSYFQLGSPYNYYNYNIKGSPYASAYPMYYPRINTAHLVTPYKTVQNPPETYAKYHYYVKYPNQLTAAILGTKSPINYEVQESGEEEEDGEGAPQTSQEEYEGGGDDDELRQEIDTDYEHARYQTDQHYKPEEEATATETYTDYGNDRSETVSGSSALPRKPRSSPYIYSHQIHYF